MCVESKRRRFGTGAGSSCDHFFVQGSGHPGLGVAPQRPDPVAGRPRCSGSRSDSFPHLDAVAGESRLSLQERSSHASPVILIVGLLDGSLDINQVWLHWGRPQGISNVSSASPRTPSTVRVADASCSAAMKMVVAESLQRRPRRHVANVSGEAMMIPCDSAPGCAD